MKILRLVVLLSIFSSAYGQSNPVKVKSWKSHPVPTDPDTIYNYNSDPNDWSVYLEKGDVYVVAETGYTAKGRLPFKVAVPQGAGKILAGERTVLKVEDGYLVGFDRGEWGGDLYWFSDDGKQYYKISNDQVVGFSVRDAKFYAIQGLAHLNTSEGSLIEIKKDNGKWSSSTYLALSTAPSAIGLDSKDNFVVVTSSDLLSIDTNKKINTLISKGMWDVYLYPNSLVVDNDVLFIGMRAGVFKYNLLTKKKEWLRPARKK